MTPETDASSKNAASNSNKRQYIIARGGTISNVTQIIAEKYYARSEAEELSGRLGRAVENYESRMELAFLRRTVSERSWEGCPYKGLAPFELEDFPIFFGRDDVIDELHQKALNNRLTILRARSGTGKTSLLKAGILPRLIKERLLLPVHVHAYEELTSAIKEVIAPASYGPWPELLHKLNLHDFLSLACACLQQFKGLAVILDQFEGFFSQLDQDHHEAFIEALADCNEDETLPAHFLIALRTDHYDDLATFQARLSSVQDNVFTLDDMSPLDVRKAITEPVTRSTPPVNFEPALLDRLLDDLGRGGMELSHLQIICAQLYEDLPEGETLITVASYEALGRAEGKLSAYLNGVLREKLAGKEEEIARDVLKELVSSEATRRVLSCDALAALVRVEESELDHVLGQLVDNRLLRRDVARDKVFCEMPYGYLIEEIMRWIDLDDLDYKWAKDLLEREVKSWRAQRTPIPKDRLEILHTQRHRFRDLDEDKLRCLVDSALHAGFAVEDWAKLAGEVGEELFVNALGHDYGPIRERAARALGEIGSPCAVESLIATLQDEDSTVRRAVVEALGKIDNLRAVDPLIVALQDEEIGHVREAVLEALAKIDAPRAVKPLITALQDGVWTVRRVAVRALGKIGDPQAINPLIKVLKDDDDDSQMRAMAATALGQLGDSDAVKPLIAALEDEDWSVRQAAAETLGEIGNSEAVKPLINVLKNDGDYYHVREAAAEALVAMSNARAVDPLIAALQDEDTRARKLAARILGEIRHPCAAQALTQALEDVDGNVRKAAAGALEVIGIGSPRALELLIATLLDKDGYLYKPIAEALCSIGGPHAVEPLIEASSNQEEAVREWVAEVVGMIGSGAVTPLAAALRQDVWQMRQTAAWALGMTDDPEAMPPLVAALADKRPDVRIAAAWALGELANPAAAEPLIKAFKDNETDHDVRRLAAYALGEIGDSDAVKPHISDAVKLLLAGLKDEIWSVRKEAAEAFGKIGDLDAVKPYISGAVKPLMAALEDEDRSVREAAAWALGEIGDSNIVKMLIKVLKDGETEGARAAAAQALGKIGDRQALDPLKKALENDGNSSVRETAAWALGEIGGSKAVKPLMAVLGDEAGSVREAAAEALGKIGDSHTVKTLTQVLKDDEAEGVRAAAAWALGKIGDRQALDPLRECLENDSSVDVHYEATMALGRLGDPETVDQIIKALEDTESSDVMEAAIWALGEIGGPLAVERLIVDVGSSFMRKAAAQALGKTGDPKAVDPLIDALRSKARRVRHKKAQAMLDAFRVEESLSDDDSGGKDDDALDALAEALGQLGEPAVKPLIEAYDEKDPKIRWAVVKALGKTGGPRAMNLLITALRDEDSYVREDATRALGENGENKAIEKLSDTLKDEIWQVRNAAAWALGEIGEPGTVNLLRTALEDEDWLVRKAAAGALEKIGTPEALKALEEWQRERDERQTLDLTNS